MSDAILVVEDQPGWEALLHSALRHGRLPVGDIRTASSYEEAVRLIHAVRFRVALLDYVLSRGGPAGPKTGLDVAAELRKTTPDGTILLITMMDPERVRVRCEDLGVILVEKGSADLEAEVLREVREALGVAEPRPPRES